MILERLEGNDLPLPKYATISSAGLDFGACLRRRCYTVQPGPEAIKTPFFISTDLSNARRRPVLPTEIHEFVNINQDTPLIVACNETIMIPLGFKCDFTIKPDPEVVKAAESYAKTTNTEVKWKVHHHVLQFHIRSSWGLRGLMLANSTGIIDEDYRGELFAVVWNHTTMPATIRHGDKIVQGVLVPYITPEIVEGKTSSTERGAGGFGSTDRQGKE